jgi:hypothetical protein
LPLSGPGPPPRPCQVLSDSESRRRPAALRHNTPLQAHPLELGTSDGRERALVKQGRRFDTDARAISVGGRASPSLVRGPLEVSTDVGASRRRLPLPARPPPPTEIRANQHVQTPRHEQLAALNARPRLMLHPARGVVARVTFPPRPNRRVVAPAAPRRQRVPRLRMRRESVQRTRFPALGAAFPARFTHQSDVRPHNTPKQVFFTATPFSRGEVGRGDRGA